MAEAEAPDRASTAAPAVRRALLERRLGRVQRVRLELEARRPGGVAARAMAAEATRLRALVAALPQADGVLAGARAAPLPPPAQASVLDEVPPTEDDGGTVEGLRFDMACGVWVTAQVPRERSWWFHLRLRQLLDWWIPGVVDAPRELAARLAGLARGDGEGAPLLPPEELSRLVEDLAAADRAGCEDPEVAGLLDLAIDLQYAATDAGDRPLEVTWQLSPRLEGTLLAVLDAPRLRARLGQVAAAQRAADQAAAAARRRALAEVLARYPGAPARHARAHWVLVNLAGCGQSVAECVRPGGVLPAGRARLDPELLGSRFGGPEVVKLRFVLNDALHIHVLDDADYRRILEVHGFPPNHEFLSLARPLVAAGYLEVEGGRIVGIEDDGLMIPGKLPPRLPPIQEVLEALGFPLDPARVVASSRVFDWVGFAAHAARCAPAVPARGQEPGAGRRRLEAAAHGQREEIVVALLRSLLADLAGRHPDAARSQLWRLAAPAAAAALAGFRVINVRGRDVACGDLPRGAGLVDEELAPYLLRKVDGS